MLSKPNRLHKKKDIENVFKKGISFKEDFLILKMLKNNSGKIRFCFIVSKKVSKKATIRNKIKRRVSSLIEINLKKIKTGIDAVVVAVPGLETKDFCEMEKAVKKLFKKAKIAEE